MAPGRDQGEYQDDLRVDAHEPVNDEERASIPGFVILPTSSQ